MKYYVDGRKVADQKLVPTWADLCAGRDPPWPKKVTKILAGQNMVGRLTNINVHSRVLSDEEMFEVMFMFYLVDDNSVAVDYHVPGLLTRGLHQLGGAEV